jgi:hypothetical protein
MDAPLLPPFFSLYPSSLWLQPRDSTQTIFHTTVFTLHHAVKPFHRHWSWHQHAQVSQKMLGLQ